MRESSEIEDKVRAIVVDELQRRLDREVLPHLCQHNQRQPLDHRRTVYGEPNACYNRISAGVENGVSLPVVQTIGLCMVGAEDVETWPGNVCEEPLDAQRCPMFVYKQSKSEVYKEFVSNLRDPQWVESNLPAAHWLMWAVNAPMTVEEGGSGLRRLWRKLLRLLFGAPPDRSVDALVYLPALDADPEENGARAPVSH